MHDGAGTTSPEGRRVSVPPQPPQQIQLETKFVWPPETYAHAQVVNHFLVTDDGQGIYVAFAYLPPFPALPEEPVTSVSPQIKFAMNISYANAKQLLGILGQLVGRLEQQKATDDPGQGGAPA